MFSKNKMHMIFSDFIISSGAHTFYMVKMRTCRGEKHSTLKQRLFLWESALILYNVRVTVAVLIELSRLGDVGELEIHTARRK